MSLPGIATTTNETSQLRDALPTTLSVQSQAPAVAKIELGNQSVSLPNAISPATKTLPSPSPSSSSIIEPATTPRERGSGSLAQRLSNSLTVTPRVPSTAAEDDSVVSVPGKSDGDLLEAAHHELKDAFDRGLLTAEAYQDAKRKLTTTRYHFVPTRRSTPVKPAVSPSQPGRPQRPLNDEKQRTAPQRPTPPQRPPGGKTRGGAQQGFARRRVVTAPEAPILVLSGLLATDLVGGAVGRYAKLESRFNGRAVYEDEVRKDRFIYYLSEYGGIWSVGFQIGSKAVALFNRSEAEEPHYASTVWNKYVGRSDTNTAKFALDEAIKLTKAEVEQPAAPVDAEQTRRAAVRESSSGVDGGGVNPSVSSTPASSSSVSAAADEHVQNASITPVSQTSPSPSILSATSRGAAVSDNEPIMPIFLEGDSRNGSQTKRHDRPLITQEIVPPLPQLQSGFIEDALGADFLERASHVP